MSKADAITAKELGDLDVVLNAAYDPPVVKLVNYLKFRSSVPSSSREEKCSMT